MPSEYTKTAPSSGADCLSQFRSSRWRRSLHSGLLLVTNVVTRLSVLRWTMGEMPRIKGVDAVRSFTRSLILLQPVSLVSFGSQPSTGGCRVLAVQTNAAGLSIDRKTANPPSVLSVPTFRSMMPSGTTANSASDNASCVVQVPRHGVIQAQVVLQQRSRASPLLR